MHFCLKAETFIGCYKLCTQDTCDEMSGPAIFAAGLTVMEVAQLVIYFCSIPFSVVILGFVFCSTPRRKINCSFSGTYTACIQIVLCFHSGEVVQEDGQ